MIYTRTVSAPVTPEMYNALESVATRLSTEAVRYRIADVVRMAIVAFIAAQPAGSTGRDVPPTPAAAFVQTFVEPREPFGVV